MLRAVKLFAEEFQRAALTLTVVVLLGIEGIFFLLGVCAAVGCGYVVGVCRYLTGVIMEDMEP